MASFGDTGIERNVGLPLPDEFNGKMEQWQEWSWQVKAYVSLFEVEALRVLVNGALESLVCNAERLFVWWILCMIFASFRFDDAVHVRPDELIMNDEGMFGVAWQTKVDRKRSGTKFVVPKVGFKNNSEWLEQG